MEQIDSWTGEVIPVDVPYVSVSNPYLHNVSDRRFEVIPDKHYFLTGENLGKWMDMQLEDALDKHSKDNYS